LNSSTLLTFVWQPERSAFFVSSELPSQPVIKDNKTLAQITTIVYFVTGINKWQNSPSTSWIWPLFWEPCPQAPLRVQALSPLRPDFSPDNTVNHKNLEPTNH